ncbi:uncharacterized protein LOC128985423 [Macrosteles quadrilineatus]|uniref:uncharacterized protein LOC128985423 n=1 Tax=Macrosteles quadrilineatus TaxID=74068 RepID=UPI0023E286ED|nr:uncharacterized protein LOC128985423 [Macrosteles quadrilineatus]
MTPVFSAVPLLAVVLMMVRLSVAVAAYPQYSKSHYSRSLWTPLPLNYYYPPRSTRPIYYPDSDYYYPQEPPSYYPIYQSVMPNYYLDQQRPYYYGYDDVTDPVEDVPEEVDMEEGSERGEAAPYGQEMWYQDSRLQDSNADVNARFLQNLILAQMYNDANRRFPVREEEESDRWVYGEPVKTSKTKTISKEDEDVRELKSLVRGPEREKIMAGTERMERSDKKRKNRKEENIFAAQSKANDWSEFRSSQYKRNNNDIKFSSRKSKTSTTAAPPEATPAPMRGQKEVVLPRPANPARAPDFQKFVNVRSEPRRHEPSVYDTIKRLLHMEDKLDEAEPESRLKKRSYIPSEESLVAQLGGLKKMA